MPFLRTNTTCYVIQSRSILSALFLIGSLSSTYNIEHLAICDDLRGKGYGGRLLNEFVEQQSKIVLLEIDPVVDELSKKRLRFYTHHVFYTNEYVHDHPAYRLKYPAHRLVVLSHSRRFSPKEYTTFAYELQSVVMKCSLW